MKKSNLTLRIFGLAAIAMSSLTALAAHQPISLYETYRAKKALQIRWSSNYNLGAKDHNKLGLGEGLEAHCPMQTASSNTDIYTLGMQGSLYKIEANEPVQWLGLDGRGKVDDDNDRRSRRDSRDNGRNSSLYGHSSYANNNHRENTSPAPSPCETFVDYFMPGMRGLTETLVLDGLNAEMTGIDARYVVQAEGLSNITALNETDYQVYFTMNFQNCLDNRGLNVTSPFVAKDMPDNLQDALSLIRRNLNQSVEQCTFSISNFRTVSLLKGYSFYGLSATGRLLFDKNDPRLFLTTTSYGHSTPTYADEYIPLHQKNAQIGELAKKAAQDMINFFTIEYGDKLLDISIQPGTPAEKSEVIRSFFQKNNGRITAWMTLIDNNFKDVQLMDKVMILMRVRAMHQAIRQLETRQQLNSVYMDRVLERIL